MSDYLAFEAAVEPMVWGKSTYTVLRLPDHIAAALEAAGAKRVEGEINDHPVNLALTKAPVIDGVFLWAGQSLLRVAEMVPGERYDVRLRKAPDDQVDTPEDVARALLQAGVLSSWEALTPGKRRGHLYQIDTAKRAETRAARIAKLAEVLAP